MPYRPTEQDKENFNELLRTHIINQNAFKLLRKNPEYKTLLKAHREEVAKRKSSLNKSSILWTRIKEMRTQAHLEARRNLDRKEKNVTKIWTQT